MTAEIAAVRPRLVRHNGTCSTCKTRISIAIRPKSALWLHTAVGAVLGAPLVSLPSLIGPISHVFLDENDCWVPTMNGRPHRECCGRTVELRTVVGKLKPDHKCDARCRVSRGFVCNCSCGGANHGRDC